MGCSQSSSVPSKATQPPPSAPPSAPPNTPFDGSVLTLRDNYWSTDVSNGGKTVTCVRSTKSCNYSKQVFGPDESVFVTVRVWKLMGELLSIGLVPHDQLSRALDFTVGEKEIPGSIGCGIKDGNVTLLMADDDPFFIGSCDTSDPTDIHMHFHDRRVEFRIGNGQFNSVELKGKRFNSKGKRFNSRYRLGVSVISEGQVAEITFVGRQPPPSAPPNTPFDGSVLTLHDNYRSTDVSNGGKTVTCVRSTKSCNYSKQVFGPDESVFVTVRVWKLMGELLSIGLVPHDQLSRALDFTVGEKEIPGSIGCGIKDGNVTLLMADDDPFFIGSCDTSDPTDIHMHFHDRRVEFRIGNGQFNSVELKGKRFNSKGKRFNSRYRLGVSVISEGQVAEITFVGRQPPPSAPPNTPFDGSVLTLHDNYRSTDVSNGGKTVTCVRSTKSCNYSKQVFGPDESVFVTVRVWKLMGELLSIGLVPHDQLSRALDFTVGEKEIPGSIGCGIKDGNVTLLMADDDPFFIGSCDTSDPTDIHMHFHDRRVEFRIGNGQFNSVELKGKRFNSKGKRFNSRYRLGVSVISEGQVAEITFVGRQPPPSAPPNTPFDGSVLTLHDNYRSTDVSNGGKTVTCVRSTKSCNYSKQVFGPDESVFVTVRVWKLMGELLSIGLVPHDQLSRALDFTVGEKEIPGSIGCGIKDGNVTLLMADDDPFFIGSCDTSDPTDIHMHFHDRRVEFRIGNGQLNSVELKGKRFNSKGKRFNSRYRLGVSVISEGQVAEITFVGRQPP
ncbi:hypothetical protein DIPPA_09402 [Diplonema papillatum]|nr:hypothetical protein DIPPA_09402 [Diplonema papillatum]